ncbi:hypothetical protein D3C78_1375310 [compost metagenome]
MYGHTAFRSKVLLRHNAQRNRKTIKFDRNSAFTAYFYSIYIENNFICATVVRNFIIIEFPCLEVCIFLEHAEVLRLVTVWYCYTRERQHRIYAGIFIVTCKKIKRSARSEIEQIQRHISIVQVSGSCILRAGTNLQFKADFTGFRYFSLLDRIVHMLGIIQDLNLIILPTKRRTNIQNSIAYNDYSLWFTVLPEGTVRQWESAHFPYLSFI